MEQLKKDPTYIHNDINTNNSYLVRLTSHMFKARKGSYVSRGNVFKTHGQVARLIQYALTYHGLEDFEGKGPVVIEYSFKNKIRCLLLKVRYNPKLKDVVSEIILISGGSAGELKAASKGMFITVRNRIDMRDYDLKPSGFYNKK